MGHCFSRCYKEKEIITAKSLDVVREVIDQLQSNVQEMGNGWVFRAGAIVHAETVKQMVVALEKGSIVTMKRLLSAGWRLEAAQALYLFLAKLKKPLLPETIQSLVLGDTENIPPEMVASDAIGLMRQDLSDRHLELVSMLLHLLNSIIRYSPADELRGTRLPLSMLPLFFNIEATHMSDWRRIAIIFVEIIRSSSVLFERSTGEQAEVVHCLDDEIINVEETEIDDDFVYVADNLIVRRYIEPVGYRGDCGSLEIYSSH